MAGIAGSTRQQWIKVFPPIQQRAIQSIINSQLTAYKTGTSTSTASVALVADTELILPYVPANIPYVLTGYLDTTVSTTGGVKIDLNGGTGVASKVNVTSIFSIAAGTQAAGGLMIALNTGANGGNVLTLGVLLQGVIMFSAPGSLILQYAQNSAAGTTTLNPTSFLRLEALDAVIAS